MLVASEQDFHSRVQEWEKQEKELEEARKNHGFTQVYPLGWKRVAHLAKKNGGAVELYAYLAQHIDPSCGAVLAEHKFLAERLNVSLRTIGRYIKFLENEGALVRIKVSGNLCAYCLNPNEVWKGYDTSKDYAAFKTKMLLPKAQDTMRRLALLVGKKLSEGEAETETVDDKTLPLF